MTEYIKSDESEKGVLKAAMLGRFSLVWEGENLVSGAKTSDSHFARLLQILIHNRETGVLRTELQELLFRDSKADDVHHLLRTDIYNVRKRLREAGLPDSKYIVYRKGKYYWTDDIEVFEDARYFEQLYEKALAEEDPEKQCAILLEACYCYNGEFLPTQTELLWVAHEEKRYREMFIDCAMRAAEYLREKNLYQDLEALGRHGVAVCPLRDLEVLVVEPLVSMGRLNEAYELYDYAIERYQHEIGRESALTLMESMEQVISSASSHATGLLDDIQAQLEEDDNGAYMCSYPTFQSIYRTTKRMIERSDKTGYLMCFNVKDLAEACSYDENKMKKVSDEMGRVICGSVRTGDIVCQYSQGQYLLLLLSKTNGGCQIAGERIRTKLKKKLPKYDFEFSASPMEAHDAETLGRDE